MREAFPWDQAPRFVLRDRDAIYGRDFAAMTRDMGMEEVLTAPRSPWQNPFVERLVGSIRRECLDHVIVWNEKSLRRTLHNYFAYYQRSRTHLALGKDAPEPRAVEPPEQGRVVAIPQVGGLGRTADLGVHARGFCGTCQEMEKVGCLAPSHRISNCFQGSANVQICRS
jgi:putative transposase